MNTDTRAEFAPTGLLANTHVQSMLASNKLRRARMYAKRPGMRAASRRLTLDCGDDVRLYGFHSPRPENGGTGKGLVVLIHGWEGCRESVYLASMASFLWDHGYAVLRLDLRDHGDSYHLNEVPFHSARLSDPLGALADIAKRVPGGEHPALIGFSLGGNFALRLALHGPGHGLNLAGVLAVSPAIDPLHTAKAIDAAPWFYGWYFKRKWHRSLNAKARLFPGRYDFDHLRAAPNFVEATRRFAPLLTEYDDWLAYLDAYTITGDRLAKLAIPATLLTAADDPVVPIQDFDGLALPDNAQLLITRHGGHCGFVQDWQFNSHVEQLALNQLQYWLQDEQENMT
ncbi:alpha/beta fold hydrolase [bacterium]|nr:alpha/beta fold hydrolase [bacterium]